VWVKNRTAHTALGGRTPYKAWTGKEADLSMARVWGCVGCILLPEPEKRAQGKLGQRGLMGVCVGVDTESKAWMMLDLTSVRVRVTRNVEFLEHVTLAEWQMGRPGARLPVGNELEVFQLFPQALVPEPYPEEGDGGEESYEQDFREPPLAKGKSAGDKGGGAPQRPVTRGYQQLLEQQTRGAPSEIPAQKGTMMQEHPGPRGQQQQEA